MFKRDELNKEAAAIVEKYGLVDDKGNALSDNGEIFKENIRREIRAYLDYCKESGHSDNDKAIARRYVTAALRWYNDEMRVQRLEQLKDMGCKLALISYIGTQRTTGLKLVEDKKEGTMSYDRDPAIELAPVDFYEHMLSADLPYIQDMCCIFADNAAKKKIHDEGKDGTKVMVTKNSMSEDYQKLREKLDWKFDKPADITNNKLANHLNEIVGLLCFLTPAERKSKKWLIKMINPDVYYIATSMFETNAAKKGSSDKAGEFIMRDEMTVIRAIFRAMYTRYNKLSYSFQNQTNGEKAARVYGANKDMAEPPVKPAEPADGGPVTLGTPEA